MSVQGVPNATPVLSLEERLYRAKCNVALAMAAVIAMTDSDEQLDPNLLGTALLDLLSNAADDITYAHVSCVGNRFVAKRRQ